MNKTIKKTDLNLKFLCSLLENGSLHGNVSEDHFVLMKNRFTNNHRIVGTLNDADSFELSYSLNPPADTVAKVVFVVGLTLIALLLILGKSILPLSLTLIGLVLYLGHIIVGNREIDKLTSQLLEYHKS